MRTTKTPDYSNKNLSFWCEPVGEMPSVVFEKGRQMNRLWNLLVECHTTFLAKHDGKKGGERTEAYKTEWQPLLKRIYNNEAKSFGLNSDETNFVTDGFKNAIRAGYDQKRPGAGMPTFKARLRSIHIPFCDRNGGRAPAWFFEKPDRRIHLRPILLPDAAKRVIDRGPARGHFTVDGQAISLRANLSQSIPPGALVKRVSLVGKLERPFGWQWKLMFSIAYPPPPPAQSDAACVGVDLGYRRFEDRIRFGMIFDGSRFHELALPLDLTNRRAAKAGKRWDIREIWELESQIGCGVEACKASLKQLPKTDWPEEARGAMQGIAKMRERGLLKVRRLLRDAEITVPELETWWDDYQRLFRKSRHLELQIVATRTHLYRNLALSLARSCAAIAWEGGLSLRDLAESAGKKKKQRKEAIAEGVSAERSPEDRIEEAAQKWRAYVCLSDFRRFLKEAVEKTTAALIDRPAAGTTNTCEECGAPVDTGPDLVLTCANGHRRDQDKGSAKMLFEEIDEGYRQQSAPLSLDLFTDQAVRAIRTLNREMV